MIPTDENQTRQQKEKASGSRVLQTWAAVFKNAKLYKPDHPSTKEAARKFIHLLNNEIFKEKLDMTVQNTDGVFLINDIFFIEESLAHYDLLRSLEDHQIEQVVFSPGVTEEEAIASCGYLMKKKTPGSVESKLQHEHILTITSEEVKLQMKREAESTTKGSVFYKRARTSYAESIESADKIFSRLLEEQALSVSDLGPMLEGFLDGLHQSPSAFSVILSTAPITNLHVQHSVNTTLLSLYIGQQLSLDPSTLKVLGIAALLHDLGRFLLPADFTTGYRLMPGDVDFIQLHARDGASFLAGVPELPMNIVRAALEHHVGFDGIGYPALPKTQKPHFFSRIIGLADFMSWGTVSDNYYHKPVPLHRLVRSLMARTGTQFDPFFVKILLPFYGLYPVGTRVRLSSGESGVVIEPNLRNITRPLVGCIDARGNRISRWLGTLSPRDEGNPYQFSIQNIIGREPAFEEYLDFLSGVGEDKK